MMDSQTSILHEMKKHSTDGKQVSEHLHSEIKNLSTILSTVERTTTEMLPQPTWILELNETNLEKETQRKRKQMSTTWKKLLNIRKQHFWKAYKCERFATTHSNWISLAIPILPRKYLIKEIIGEPEEETKLRWDLTVIKT